MKRLWPKWFVLLQKRGGEPVSINGLEELGRRDSQGICYCNGERAASVKRICLFKQCDLIRGVDVDEEDCLGNIINMIINLEVEVVSR